MGINNTKTVVLIIEINPAIRGIIVIPKFPTSLDRVIVNRNIAIPVKNVIIETTIPVIILIIIIKSKILKNVVTFCLPKSFLLQSNDCAKDLFSYIIVKIGNININTRPISKITQIPSTSINILVSTIFVVFNISKKFEVKKESIKIGRIKINVERNFLLVCAIDLEKGVIDLFIYICAVFFMRDIIKKILIKENIIFIKPNVIILFNDVVAFENTSIVLKLYKTEIIKIKNNSGKNFSQFFLDNNTDSFKISKISIIDF